MKSRLFKRAERTCNCEEGKCSCDEGILTRKDVQSALEDVKKLASYFEEVDASFEHLRWASNAVKKLSDFTKKNTDVVDPSVFSTVGEVNEFKAKLAAKDFDYTSMVDDSSPNAFVDCEMGDASDNVDGVTKVAGDSDPIDNPYDHDLPEDPSKVAGASGLQPFDDHMWQAFAGAERFEDGSVPLYAEVSITGFPFSDSSEALLIVCGNGDSSPGAVVQAFLGEDDAFILKEFPSKDSATEEVSTMLETEVNYKTLLSRGWTVENLDEHDQATLKSDYIPGEDLETGDLSPKSSSKKKADSELLGDGTGSPGVSTSGKERWENFSNEALTNMIQTLSETDEFAVDKESQKSVSEMADVLSARPITVAEETEEVKKAASKAFKGLRLAGAIVADPVVTPPVDTSNPSEVDLGSSRLNLPNDSMSNELRRDPVDAQDALAGSMVNRNLKSSDKEFDSYVKNLGKLEKDLQGICLDNVKSYADPLPLLAVSKGIKEALDAVSRLKGEAEARFLVNEASDAKKEKKSSRVLGLRIASTE